MRYAIWAAVSTDQQAAADKDSLDEQTRKCRAAGEAKGRHDLIPFVSRNKGGGRARLQFGGSGPPARAAPFGSGVALEVERLGSSCGPADGIVRVGARVANPQGADYLLWCWSGKLNGGR